MSYVEEAVEVGEVEDVCDMREDVQSHLALVGRLLLQRLAALVRGAPQGRGVPGVQGLH